MEEKNLNRRSFFKFAVAGAVVAPALLGATKALAEACPAKAPAGKPAAEPGVGMAKSLDYVADATQSKNAKYTKGSHCGNCKYYNDKKAEGGMAPCTMMGMKFVSNCGWCKSYLKKA
jgi:hypothetical protein